MAITYRGAGTVAVGTTSLSIGMPAGAAVGDLLVMTIANKYPANGPSTPSGWTAPTNNQIRGVGGTGLDTGDVYSTVFYRVCTGSEGASVSVTLTSANASVGRIFDYYDSAGSSPTWDVACSNGQDLLAGTGWSISCGAPLDVVAGDWLIASSGINTDNYTFTSHAFSGGGAVTYGTPLERQDSGTTNGDDCGLLVADIPASSGSDASEIVNYSATASGSTGTAPTGGTVVMRIRATQPSGVDPFGQMGFFGV